MVGSLLPAVGLASASAHRGGRPTPTDALLECINRAEGSPGWDSRTNPTYRGAFQSDRRFEVSYAIRLIPPAHWHLWGSDTNERADRWHPMIQREMARNGIRARGLSPWPPARGCR